MLSFSLLATLLVGISVATIAPAQAVATCAQGGPCALGDTGPGGGKVFYVSSTTFTCGPTLNLLCNYLEAAPGNWNTSIAQSAPWAVAAFQKTDVAGITNHLDYQNTRAAIGIGLRNSNFIVNQNGTYNATSNNYAAGAARSYQPTVNGIKYSDWYLPSTSENNQMCKWQRGRPWNSDEILCTGGTLNSGIGAEGFVNQIYWTSSECHEGCGFYQHHEGGQQVASKASDFYMRPIRAFGISCAEGGNCAIGDTGPGGGKVFYVSSTTFTCGPAADLTCKYLEAAPKNWSGGISDPTAIYAANDYNPTGISNFPGNQLGSIGRGYSDSIWILAYNLEAPTVAAGIARAYLGGGKNDWYLPATAELNLLCQVARGVTQNVTTPCTGGTTSPDFSSGIYWATSGYESSKAWAQDFSTGVQSGQTKRNTLYVRPIRAFGGPAATAPGAATVTSTVVNNSKITVNFTAPTSNGNASILTYKYSTDGGATFSTRATGTTASPLVITTSSSDGSALVNETTYSVQIKAVNSVGDGPATTSTSAKVMYVLGDTGPGGGKVFYVSPTTFKCGSDWLSDCKYLEAAPKTWSGGTSDPTAIYTATDYDPTGRSGSPGLSLFGLGRGYRDSNNILERGEASSVAAGIARGYRGGGKNDWYLPHTAEINLLCQLARGVVQNVEIECSGGTNSADFNASNYWTTFSDDRMYLSGAWMQNFSNGIFSGGDKQTAYSVRPIRAFGGPAAKVAQATLTVNPATGTFGSTVTLVSAGGSGSGAVTYATTSTNCSISGSTLSVTAVATCAVIATKATDSSYNAATSASVNIVFSKGTPALTLVYPASNSMTYSLSGKLAKSSASRSGDGSISYATPSTTCSVDTSYGELTAVAAGSCSIVMSVAESSNYIASSLTVAVTINKAVQSTFSFISDSSSKSYPYSQSLNFTPAGGSGSGAIMYAVSGGTASSCALANTSDTNTVTATSAGTCLISATKAADDDYLVAVSTAQTYTFALAALAKPDTPTLVAVTTSTTSVTVSFTAVVGASSYTVKTYGNDGTTQVGSDHTSFVSGSTIIGLSAATDYKARVIAIGDGIRYSNSEPSDLSGAVRTNDVGLVSTFGVATSTPTGFDVNLTNYNADYTFNATVSGGSATVDAAVGSDLPLTVTGLTAGASATLTVTASRVGFATTTGTVTASALVNKTVTFKPNFTTSPPSDMTQSANTTLNLLSNIFTRANFTFTGWNTSADGTGTPYANNASYDFANNLPLFAQWVQNSLYGIAPTDLTLVGSLTAAGINSRFEGSTGGSTVAIEYETGSLPTGTVINIHLLGSTARATSLITTTTSFIVSFVVSWLTPNGTVPLTDPLKPLRMTITNTLIKKGASVYSVIGTSATLIGTAIADGSVAIAITEDPEIVIAMKKPDAPTGVLASSGDNASAKVSWTAPSDGGSAITMYTATSNAGQTCTSTTTSCSVTGLANGTPYTFTVTATNTIGTGDPSTASSAATPAAPIVVTPPVVTPPSSGGGGGGYTYVEPTPTVDPAVVAAALAAQKAVAEKAAAAAKALADAKALAEAKASAEKKAAEEAELLATLKALQEKADAEALAAAKKLQEELEAAQLLAEEELNVATALKLAEEERVAGEKAVALAASKKITTLYSTTAAFKLNKTYTKRLSLYTKKIAVGSTVTCIGYAKSSKTLSYAKAKVVATKQAKALCTSMKKINPTLMTKSTVLPASKAPVTTVNKKWIPVSYRVQSPVN